MYDPTRDTRPVILLLSANARPGDDQGFLRNLAQERRVIQDKFAPLSSTHRLVVETNVTHRRFADLLRVHLKRIIGVHFGGHADVRGLQFENERGDLVPAYVGGLAGRLAAMPELRWVFLNGCVTRTQVDELHAQVTVPTIVTEHAIVDAVALEFAEQFYASLIAGLSLAEAYAAANDYLALLHPDPQGTTRMLRPADEALEQTTWPWTLVTPDGDEQGARWRLVQTPTASALRAIDESASVAGPPEHEPAGLDLTGSGEVDMTLPASFSGPPAEPLRRVVPQPRAKTPIDAAAPGTVTSPVRSSPSAAADDSQDGTMPRRSVVQPPAVADETSDEPSIAAAPRQSMRPARFALMLGQVASLVTPGILAIGFTQHFSFRKDLDNLFVIALTSGVLTGLLLAIGLVRARRATTWPPSVALVVAIVGAHMGSIAGLCFFLDEGFEPFPVASVGYWLRDWAGVLGIVVAIVWAVLMVLVYRALRGLK